MSGTENLYFFGKYAALQRAIAASGVKLESQVAPE
jgi:hypothetical protein